MIVTHTIGKHRPKWPYWLSWFVFLINRKQITRKLCFGFGSKYLLPGDAQNNWNKLFGFTSYRVHQNSARFCWRYNPDINKFEIEAYYYIDGVRDWHIIKAINANTSVKLTIKKDGESTVWKLQDAEGTYCFVTSGIKWRPFMFLLGPYFGGKKPAPQKINYLLKKIMIW